MVFYFTGTGNSLYAAAQLDARTCSIPQAIRRGCLKFSDSEIGIVCPVYGHEMPVMVQEFLKKAELKTDYLYLILTYGSFQGNAAELAEKVLAAAGKKADYIRTLLMPDNFLPDFDMEIEKKLDKNVEGQPAEIRADLAAHRRYREPVTDEQRRLHAEYAEGMNGLRRVHQSLPRRLLPPGKPPRSAQRRKLSGMLLLHSELPAESNRNYQVRRLFREKSRLALPQRTRDA